LIVTGKRSISYSLNDEALALHGVSLKTAIASNGILHKIVIDKSGPIWRERRLPTTP